MQTTRSRLGHDTSCMSHTGTKALDIMYCTVPWCYYTGTGLWLQQAGDQGCICMCWLCIQSLHWSGTAALLLMSSLIITLLYPMWYPLQCYVFTAVWYSTYWCPWTCILSVSVGTCMQTATVDHRIHLWCHHHHHDHTIVLSLYSCTIVLNKVIYSFYCSQIRWSMALVPPEWCCLARYYHMWNILELFTCGYGPGLLPCGV